MIFARLATVFCAIIIGSTSVMASTSVPYAEPAMVKHQMTLDKGHVILLNFWATWCPGCVAEYPNLVLMDKKYRGRGLDVIAVSLDSPDDIRGKVLPFVKHQKAQFRQYVLKVDDIDTAVDDFDPAWQGDLPRTYIYSRSGRLVKTLDGPQKLAIFDHAVKLGFAGK